VTFKCDGPFRVMMLSYNYSEPHSASRSSIYMPAGETYTSSSVAPICIFLSDYIPLRCICAGIGMEHHIYRNVITTILTFSL
jgi:hypothetical protein